MTVHQSMKGDRTMSRVIIRSLGLAALLAKESAIGLPVLAGLSTALVRGFRGRAHGLMARTAGFLVLGLFYPANDFC